MYSSKQTECLFLVYHRTPFLSIFHKSPDLFQALGHGATGSEDYIVPRSLSAKPLPKGRSGDEVNSETSLAFVLFSQRKPKKATEGLFPFR